MARQRSLAHYIAELDSLSEKVAHDPAIHPEMVRALQKVIGDLMEGLQLQIAHEAREAQARLERWRGR